MPATAARIGFITQEFRTATATTANPTTRYGALARETDDPVETFFDAEADAVTVATARQALLSVERRRFRVTVNDIQDALALSYAPAAPLATYVDTERSANLTTIVSDISIDLHKQVATMTLWG